MTEVDDGTILRRDFGQRLARIATSWRREIDLDLRRFDLTDATWRPLYYLGHLQPPVRQTDLAHALSVEAPSLVRVLDVLERRDLIARDVDGKDRRSRIVTLTRAGRILSDRVLETADRVSARLLQGVPVQTLRDCLAVFDTVVAATQDPRSESVASAGARSQGGSVSPATRSVNRRTSRMSHSDPQGEPRTASGDVS